MKKTSLLLGLLLIFSMIILPSTQVMAGTTKVQAVAISSQSPNPVAPGSSAAYSLTITRVDPKSISTSGSFNATLTIVSSTLPSDAVISFNPNIVSFVSTETTKTSTLMITVGSTTNPGTYSFTVRATRNEAPNDHQEASSTLVVVKSKFTILASAGAGGSISPSGTVIADSGTSPAFTISPNLGYRVFDVLVDNISVGPVTSYVFTNIQADHTIATSFKINIDLSLPSGVIADISTSSSLPPGILLPISSDGTINGNVYFIVIVTGTLTDKVTVTVQ